MRRLLTIFVGLVIGPTVNGALIMFGSSLIAPPVGVDLNNAERLA